MNLDSGTFVERRVKPLVSRARQKLARRLPLDGRGVHRARRIASTEPNQ